MSCTPKKHFPLTNQQINSNSIISIFYALIALAYLTIGWACFQGIEITDESFYVSGYYNEVKTALFPSFYFEIYKGLFGWLNLQLSGIRLLRLLFTLLSCIVLALGVIQKQKNEEQKKDSHFIIILSLLGGLITYSWGPLAISYNSFSLIFTCTTVGLFFLREKEKRRKIFFLQDVLLGIVFFFLFSVKFSNAILLFLTLFIYKLVLFERSKFSLTQLIQSIIRFTIGILIAIVLIFENISSFTQQLSRLILSTLAKIGGETTSPSLFLIYKNDAISLFHNIWIPLIILTPLLILKQLKPSFSKKIYLFAQLVFLFLVYKNNWWIGGTPRRYHHLELYIVIFCIAFFWSNVLNWNKKSISLLLLLLSIPFLGAAGTNNGLSAQILFYMPFFMLAFYLLIKKIEWKILNLIFINLVILLGISQSVIGVVFHPYRDIESLTEKKVKLDNNGVFHGQYLGKRMTSLYTNLKEFENNGIKYLFTYSHQTGLPLLLCKTPYSADWFNKNLPDRICNVIHEKEKIDEKNIMFIIPKDIKNGNKVNTCLTNAGINFPKNYTMVKEVEYSTGENSSIILEVYIPSL